MRNARFTSYAVFLALCATVLWLIAQPRAVPVGDPIALPAEYQGRLALFVLAGQSNMGAGGLPTYTAPVDAQIFVFGHDSQWRYAVAQRSRGVFVEPSVGTGPGLAFAQQLRAADPTLAIGLIPCAQSGTSMTQWRPHSPVWPMYRSCVARARAAMAQGHIAGMLFFQGETDALDAPLDPAAPLVPTTWAAEFAALVAAARADLHAPQLPVVFAQIGTTTSDAPNWSVVQEQQRSVALPNVAMIPTADLARTDDVHFTPQSYQTIGARFATAYRSLSAGNSR